MALVQRPVDLRRRLTRHSGGTGTGTLLGRVLEREIREREKKLKMRKQLIIIRVLF